MSEYVESLADVKHCIHNNLDIKVKNLTQYDDVRNYLLDMAEFYADAHPPTFLKIYDQVEMLDQEWGKKWDNLVIKTSDVKYLKR